MKLAELDFMRPNHLQAAEPPEQRGLERDEVRLLVSTPHGHQHTHFYDLASFLEPGDLLIYNDSATLAASLPAEGAFGPFILNLSTHYGRALWLAEPRWSARQPGPLPFNAGETFTVGEREATFLAPYPGLPRLWFVELKGDIERMMQAYGEPIRYAYTSQPFPLEAYQTIFAKVPGSAEMPSAARPFTERVLRKLETRGIRLSPITLHTGVSSLEVETEDIEQQVLYPEPFAVPEETAAAFNVSRKAGGRIIAVGTTVVRALESSWNGRELVATGGFTRRYVHPGHTASLVDGLITGFHDPKASHLAMLYAVAGKALVQEAYTEAVRAGYLWHEFGDSHLIFTERNGWHSVT